jgi:OOP family OmpA-OmpF porin
MAKRYVKWIVCMMSAFLLTGFSNVAAADLQAKLAAGELAQKVDAFEVIYDSTLSMNDMYKGSSKLNQEKSLVTLFNDTIPDLKLGAVGRAFGQFQPFGDTTTKALFGPGEYSKSALPQAIGAFKEGSGFSPLDAALDGATADLKSQTGQLAVIAFSDGEDMANYKPVAAAQRLKSAYGDRVCIYTVHIGESAAGRKVMQQVADAGQCGFMVTGDSISSPDAMSNFVEKVFLKKGEPKPIPAPVVQEEVKAPAEEAPKVVVTEPVSIRIDILFDTGKSTIKPKYHNEIKKVADFMQQHPDAKMEIQGHTDNVGKAAYNQKLSQARANSVMKYLTTKFGIAQDRLTAKGYGETKPIASNKTKAGKQQNRRVQAVAQGTVEK